MNILPKKRWHVRTRENIARVRKDEAAAAEEEKKRIERIELAEKEARTEVLKQQAREKYGVPKKEETKKEEVPISKPEVKLVDDSGHVNLFYELDDKTVVSNKKNEEHEKEVKAEKEKEEMKIGYLTYLGQDTNELTGNVSWYNKAPVRPKIDDEEIGLREKLRHDPLKDIRKYLDAEGVKTSVKTSTTPVSSSSRLTNVPQLNASSVSGLSYISPLNLPTKDKKKKRKKDESRKERKKRKKDEKIQKLAMKILEKEKRMKKKAKKEKLKKRRRRRSSSSPEQSAEVVEKPKPSPSVDIEKLRAERLQREKIERQRAAELLARLEGDTNPPEEIKETPKSPEIIQKYSSQFNPMIARQNYTKD